MAPVFASLYFDGGYVSLTTKFSSRLKEGYGIISNGAGGAQQPLRAGQRAGLQFQREETRQIDRARQVEIFGAGAGKAEAPVIGLVADQQHGLVAELSRGKEAMTDHAAA